MIRSIRCFSSTRLFSSQNKPPLPSSNDQFASRPSPLPLGDRKQQEEMMKLIRRNQEIAESTPNEKHKDAEKEPLAEFKDGINPSTGEVDGPKGPEPTRYGDWERKGRVFDF